MKKIDLNRYQEFVTEVTSKESNSNDAFLARLESLAVNKDVKISLLLTAAIGLGSETGEFQEIVKKIVFQGKPLTEENRYHMMRELGDIFWYWTNACRSLGLDPNDVIAQNVSKLEARYPSGHFDAYYSENRKEGDI
jgi:NTP pyrophosphatase (non-canonical NTP hydrolase)